MIDRAVVFIRFENCTNVYLYAFLEYSNENIQRRMIFREKGGGKNEQSNP
jgi:hypothetical protein